MQKLIPHIFIVYSLLADTLLCPAQVLEGALSGRIDAGDYLVIGNIRVEEYDSLQISPGAHFEFAGNYAFDIFGFISAEGNDQDSITFTPQSDSIVWAGIHFNDSCDSGSAISYCLITGSDSAGITIENSSPSISNSGVVYNSGYDGAGGIFCYQADPVIFNCNVSFNQAHFGGGGINCYQSDPVIENCVIKYNSAVNGGGIYVYQCDNAIIRDCTIDYNESADRGGGIELKNSNAIVEGCEISYNETLNDGGGIDCYNSEPVITGCTVANNSAFIGGGIHTYSSDFVLKDSFISANWSNNGGGLYCDPNSDVRVTECLFEYNSATSGSGILCEQFGSIEVDHTIFRWHYSNLGSGIYCSHASLKLSNCVFWENEAAYDGSAIFCGNNSDIDISESIFYVNFTSPCIGFGNSTNTSVTYCDFYYNTAQNFSGSIPPLLEQVILSNLNGDSCDYYYNLYMDPQFYSMTGDSAYYLSENSPCIDAGNPYSILDPDSTIADMGRFYFDYGLNTISDLAITAENDNIILDWEDIPSAAGYMIFRDDTPFINIFLTDPIDETLVSHYTDYGVANQTGYFYRITYTLE